MSRQRRKILSEEDYTRDLSDIIERDYYPDLSDLEYQVLLQERREQRDYQGAIFLRRQHREFQEHRERERAHEESQERSSIRVEPRPLDHESLTGFHARVTSEDNAEFESEQRKEIEEKRLERSKLFRLTDTPSRAQELETPLRLASEAYDASPHHPQFSAQDPSNSFFFPPKRIENGQKPDNLFLLENGSSNNDSALMPPPKPKTKEAEKLSRVEYIPKRSNEKRIEPSATRFSSTLSVVSRPRPDLEATSDESSVEYTTDASTDLDDMSTEASLTVQRERAAKRRRRELNTIVDMPSNLNAHATNSETDRTIEAAKPTFVVAEENSRDKAARKAEKMMEHRRKRSMTPKNHSSLTPGAQKILAKTNRPVSARSRNSFGSALRSSYTPRRANSTSSSLVRRGINVSTPRIPSTITNDNAPKSRSGASTEGLLKLPPL